MVNSTPVPVDEVERKLSESLVGAVPWQVLLGHGTSVLLDFGDTVPPMDPGGLARGTFHLWISGAAWRLEEAGVAVTASEDIGSAMAQGLRRLAGVPVERVSLPSSTRDLVLSFNGDRTLRTFRCQTEDDAWRFFTPDGAFHLDRTGECQSRRYGALSAQVPQVPPL